MSTRSESERRSTARGPLSVCTCVPAGTRTVVAVPSAFGLRLPPDGRPAQYAAHRIGAALAVKLDDPRHYAYCDVKRELARALREGDMQKLALHEAPVDLPEAVAALASVDLIVHAGDIGSAAVLDELGSISTRCGIDGVPIAQTIARSLATTDFWRWMRQPTTWIDIVILVTLLFPASLANFGFLRILRSVMDRLIEQGEHGLVDKEPDPGLVDAATKGGPGKDTAILVYKVYYDGFKALDMGASAAQSVVLMAIVIALTVVQFRFVEKKVQY